MNETLPTPTELLPSEQASAVKVLVLCHGNVCRSPLAAAVLRRELGAEAVRSGACKVYDGKTPPAAKKIRDFASTTLGLDLSQHRATSVTTEDCDWADLILYMDNGNYERMKELLTSEQLKKAKCLAGYIGKDRLPDPAFTARGVMLEKLLTWVVLASEACARELKTTKQKDPV